MLATSTMAGPSSRPSFQHRSSLLPSSLTWCDNFSRFLLSHKVAPNLNSPALFHPHHIGCLLPAARGPGVPDKYHYLHLSKCIIRQAQMRVYQRPWKYKHSETCWVLPWHLGCRWKRKHRPELLSTLPPPLWILLCNVHNMILRTFRRGEKPESPFLHTAIRIDKPAWPLRDPAFKCDLFPEQKRSGFRSFPQNVWWWSPTHFVLRDHLVPSSLLM